jgi:hypothetical protein
VIRNIWDQQIDPDPFYTSWPKVYPLLRQVTLLHYRASAASASKFYRVVAYVGDHGLPQVQIASPLVPKLDKVSDSVANGTFYHQLNKLRIPAPEASMAARNMVSGAMARFALMGGRDTVIGTALSDPAAGRWERKTETNAGTGAVACGFCVMHATRGPYSAGMTDFHPHDYCHCVATPLFRGQQSVNEELKAQWKQVTEGKRGPEARAAWEAHYAANTTNRDSSGTQGGQVQGSGSTQPVGRGTEVPNA